MRKASTASAGSPGHGPRDWRGQLRARLRGREQLCRFLGVPPTPAGSGTVPAGRFPVAVTPYYASRIRVPDPSDPIFRLCMPDAREAAATDALREDPLDEAGHMPVPGLIRRYADRAVLLATNACAVYCRHCTRRHSVGATGGAVRPADLARACAWLRANPTVKEVLVSGGDPFVLPTDRIERILTALRRVPSIEILRIGTRTPVVLPQRITTELMRALRRYHPLWLNTHFNHPAELTPEATRACGRLADAGIPVGNQTVLLRGVNDDADTLEQLFRGLVRMRVRPYYLLQCDPVAGVGHFRVPLRRGLAILAELRARLSGLAMPAFAVDVPGAPGKVVLSEVRLARGSDGRDVIETAGGGGE